jgi:uncharacterized membrane protein YfcA
MEILGTPGGLALLVSALLAAGTVSGLLAGLFGVGGGAVLVPVLYQSLAYVGVDEAVRMHLSVGSSVAVIVATSIRSFMAHRRHGAVDMNLLKDWLIAVPLGAVAAGIVSGAISGAALRAIFAGVASLVALQLLLGVKNLRIGSDLPGQPFRAAVGVLIGVLSAFMGIGGGVLSSTFMTLYGRPIHQAIATSSGVGVLISIPGVVGYAVGGWGAQGLPPLSLGFVNLIAVAIIMPVTLLLAPFGARLAHRLSRRQLETAFGIFLLAVAIRFALSLLGSGGED